MIFLQGKLMIAMDVLNILKGKCPRCKEGEVFEQKEHFWSIGIPEMKSRCEKCNFKFEREPGFFFGAMFVSYALAVSQFVAFFVIMHFIFGVSLLYTFFGIIFIAILLSGFNFKTSRLIWIYLFHKS